MVSCSPPPKSVVVCSLVFWLFSLCCSWLRFFLFFSFFSWQHLFIVNFLFQLWGWLWKLVLLIFVECFWAVVESVVLIYLLCIHFGFWLFFALAILIWFFFFGFSYCFDRLTRRFGILYVGFFFFWVLFAMWGLFSCVSSFVGWVYVVLFCW